METQDAHEDILVSVQVGHSLDILYVGMLHQNIVYTSSSQYILVRTSIYLYLPIYY